MSRLSRLFSRLCFINCDSGKGWELHSTLLYSPESVSSGQHVGQEGGESLKMAGGSQVNMGRTWCDYGHVSIAQIYTQASKDF